MRYDTIAYLSSSLNLFKHLTYIIYGYCLPAAYFFIPKIIVDFRTDLHKMKINTGTYKVRNEIETKRNETKRNQRKRNETK